MSLFVPAARTIYPTIRRGTDMYSIFVTLNVKLDHLEQFTSASIDDARGSVRDEPGCFRFDILKDQTIPTRFYLYEVYRDEDAFGVHKTTPHFKRWWAAVEDLLEGSPDVVRMTTVFPSDSGWK